MLPQTPNCNPNSGPSTTIFFQLPTLPDPADKISHYLPNKTTRDCVQYYYRNKKSAAFKDAYRKLELKHRR